MTLPLYKTIGKTMFATLLVAATLCGGAATRPAQAQDEAPPVPDALVQMTEAHRALKSFSGVIRTSDSKSDSREITLAFRRPDRLRAVIVEKSKGKNVRGGPILVYVDGKNTFILQKKKWTRKLFKAGDGLFSVYADLVGEYWASDLFSRPAEFTIPNAFSVHYATKDEVENDVPVTIVTSSYVNSQASIGYNASYTIGQKDRLLRAWDYSTSANSPLHSWDEVQKSLTYSQIKVNPDLPDPFFAPPADAIKKTQKSARPARRKR